MARHALFPLLVLVLASCANAPPTVKPIEFLTRSGCVQTKTMQVRTETAVKELGLTHPYTVVDLDTLAPDDVRKGYPTPTLLVDGVDLFGMAKPTPPFPEPT